MVTHRRYELELKEDTMNKYAVHDPKHNLVELVKECILLERHLFDPSKYCEDCIRKHLLTIEAFAGPELASLDLDQEYQDIIDRLALAIPNWKKAWIRGVSPQSIAQDIRELRKALTPICFSDTADMLELDEMMYPSLSETVYEITCPFCEEDLLVESIGNYPCPFCEEELLVENIGDQCSNCDGAIAVKGDPDGTEQ